MCLSSRIIMVLAWIYRNIFALCVALQVGSLLAVAGRRIQKVHTVEQEERPLVGQARTVMYTSSLSASAWARTGSCGAVGAERGLANRIGECCRRALSSVAAPHPAD